jgi:hypothetical protein
MSPDPGADKWADQWARIARWFTLLSKTNAGRPHHRESDYYRDEAYSFFQNAYHFKDWLKNDPAVSARVSDVESVVAGSQNLRLCGDLCNGSKHLRLTAPKESADTKLGKQEFRLAVGGESPIISAKYEVNSGGKAYDAYTLAQACMAEWESYLAAKGLLPRG